ncbi:MAG: cupin domain-containing protein [Geminicoccaceae bacterium]
MTKGRVRVVRPKEGDVTYGAGDAYRQLAYGSHTDNCYYLMEATVPPGGGPPRHMQTREEEGFYVLEGEVEFEADGETIVAPAGTFLNVPKDVPHRFENKSGTDARMLILFAPAGLEKFFAEASGKDGPEIGPIAARYGIKFV